MLRLSDANWYDLGWPSCVKDQVGLENEVACRRMRLALKLKCLNVMPSFRNVYSPTSSHASRMSFGKPTRNTGQYGIYDKWYQQQNLKATKVKVASQRD